VAWCGSIAPPDHLLNPFNPNELLKIYLLIYIPQILSQFHRGLVYLDLPSLLHLTVTIHLYPSICKEVSIKIISLVWSNTLIVKNFNFNNQAATNKNFTNWSNVCPKMLDLAQISMSLYILSNFIKRLHIG
jgi:hypothetical protein